jgi:hypothetical protein
VLQRDAVIWEGRRSLARAMPVRMSVGQRAIVRQRLGKAHRDAGANWRRKPDEKCPAVPSKAAAKRGARVKTRQPMRIARSKPRPPDRRNGRSLSGHLDFGNRTRKSGIAGAKWRKPKLIGALTRSRARGAASSWLTERFAP